MTPNTTPPTVLIAAADPSQTTALAQMLATVRPGVRALAYAEADGHDPILAMVVESPGPSVGELSRRVRASHPSLDLVVIAPSFDEPAIAAAAEVQARALATSPCEPGALARLLTELDRKRRWPGTCAAIETAELLRLHTAAASDGVLHPASTSGSGAIHLDEGKLVHAHADELRGVEAVRALLGWPDAKATWIAGRSASVRTIVGPIAGLLEREQVGGDASRVEVPDAPCDVIEKLERLAQTPDILAAYLLRNSEIISGRQDPALDQAVISRALSRLSRVFHDMEEQQGDGAGTEIQATVGEHRLVVDRLGPSRLGFQIGVVVRQATPVCKSLRRLLRQIDRSFRKSLTAGARGSGPALSAEARANLHRVA